MQFKMVSMLLIFIMLLNISPTVLAPGTINVDIYEDEKEVVFKENEASKTIEMEGAVNFTGYSVIPVVVQLSSEFDLGSSTISPVTVTFHTTGSEEFTVTLMIPNEYENGTIGVLAVSGMAQQGGIVTSVTSYANIVLLNYSQPNNGNQNLNNSEDHKGDDNSSGIGGVLMISIILIVIAIVAVFIYKKRIK